MSNDAAPPILLSRASHVTPHYWTDQAGQLYRDFNTEDAPAQPAVKCSRCGRETTEGWTRLGGLSFCPDHVEIVNDQAPLAEPADSPARLEMIGPDAAEGMGLDRAYALAKVIAATPGCYVRDLKDGNVAIGDPSRARWGVYVVYHPTRPDGSVKGWRVGGYVWHEAMWGPWLESAKAANERRLDRLAKRDNAPK